MGQLVDLHGRPLTFVDNATRERAKKELQEFVAKNKQLIQDYWKLVGYGSAIPVKYDVDNKRWVWVGPR